MFAAGTLINTCTVIVGGTIGLFVKSHIADKYKVIFFQAIGLFTLVIGIKMSLDITAPLAVALSLVLGGFTGAWCNLESKTERLGERLKQKISSKNDRFCDGLITAFLLFCVGSMSIIGAIEEGFGHTSDLLLTKAIMDGFSAMLLASAMGIGVVFAAIPLLIYQGGISLLVYFLGDFIAPEIINGLTVVGGVILIGLSINILEIKKLSVINLLPSLLYIIIFTVARMHLPW